MAYRQYTKCYDHTPGDKPFNQSDLVEVALVHGLLPGVLFGALTGLAVGLGVGGPIGAVIGIVVGIVTGVAVGFAMAIQEVSLKWRYHRLVCLGGPKCAVGTVRPSPDEKEAPTRGGLGDFDNDQFFDVALMPHRTEDAYVYTERSDNYKAAPPKPGVVDKTVQSKLDAHPANDVYIDGFQGSDFMRPSIGDLPYETRRSRLHVEAEGDFWVRMNDLALALGSLLGVLTVVTVGAAAGGAAAGWAAGCAIGGLFGPIGCIIGGIIGAIIGAAVGGGAAAAVSYVIVKPILDAIFAANPGNVEDANVGDKALGPISNGDKVAVLGEHVYDGFHEGWHEFHPLMAVVKLGPDETPFYLEWDPDFPDGGTLPVDVPGMPSDPANDITHVSVDDMRMGLNSDKFRRRCEWVKKRWCDRLHDAFDPTVTTHQGTKTQRWAVHPTVDGCTPDPPDPPPPH